MPARPPEAAHNLDWRKTMNLIKRAPPPREPHYFARVGTENRGPYNLNALETLALNGTIAPTTLLAIEGSTDFKPATEWPFFARVFPAKTWELVKAPPAFAVLNEGPKAPQAESGQRGHAPGSGAHARAIASMKEFQARSAADPNEPIIIATMNEATFKMSDEGISQEKALKRIFAANKEVNRTRDRLAKHSRTSESAALFRRTATKYALTLALTCAALLYFYKGARTNGVVALGIIGSIYGFCLVASHWIVRMPRSVYYLVTALELYVCSWSVWVIIAIFREARISDPFLALFHCLTRWRL